MAQTKSYTFFSKFKIPKFWDTPQTAPCDPFDDVRMLNDQKFSHCSSQCISKDRVELSKLFLSQWFIVRSGCCKHQRTRGSSTIPTLSLQIFFIFLNFSSFKVLLRWPPLRCGLTPAACSTLDRRMTKRTLEMMVRWMSDLDVHCRRVVSTSRAGDSPDPEGGEGHGLLPNFLLRSRSELIRRGASEDGDTFHTSDSSFYHFKCICLALYYLISTNSLTVCRCTIFTSHIFSPLYAMYLSRSCHRQRPLLPLIVCRYSISLLWHPLILSKDRGPFSNPVRCQTEALLSSPIQRTHCHTYRSCRKTEALPSIFPCHRRDIDCHPFCKWLATSTRNSSSLVGV